jgi:chaperonin GroEL (HSP60 family)
MQLFLDEEERMLKEMVASVTKVGANVVFCEKGIDDLAYTSLPRQVYSQLKA